LMAVQQINDDESKVARFEKAVHDVETSRHLALQTGVKVKMLEKVNVGALENVQRVVDKVLPILRQEIVIAGITDDIQALANLTTLVTKMANDAIIHSAENTAKVMVDVATQTEKGLIEMDTFKKANNALLKGVEQTIQIAIDGAVRREQEMVEFQNLEAETARILFIDPTNRQLLKGKK